jgi:hypothetical protein
MGSYLLSELLVSDGVAIGSAKCLLQKCEKDRDDNDSLERLTKDDEEDGNGKDVFGHVGKVTVECECECCRE